MADWNTPALTDTYTNFLAFLKDRDLDLAKWFDGTTETNIATGTKRWNAAGATFESWNGTAWIALASVYNIKAATAGDADTVGGYATSALRNDLLIPAGTKMVFHQASAPTGWTQITTQNDKALRVVSGVGGGTGGTHSLSTPPNISHTHAGPSHAHAGASHTHGYTQVVNHTHNVTINDPGHYHTSPNGLVALTGGGHQFAGAGGDSFTVNTAMDTYPNITGISASTANPTGGLASGITQGSGTGTTSYSGTGNTSSANPTAYAPQYIDVIVCQKN